MNNKTLGINRAVEIAKKKHKEGNLIQANEIYKSLINKRLPYDLLVHMESLIKKSKI